jgi:DNA-binding PucR family transcriptional regulator
VVVRITQDLGSSRMLLGWYGSDAFRDLAEEIVAPLLALGDSELVRTLAAYLDRACSASHTARMLGVHRNTVNQRIARAEQALGTPLTDADTRLALQLALRARARTGGEAARSR